VSNGPLVGRDGVVVVCGPIIGCAVIAIHRSSNIEPYRAHCARDTVGQC
jgi:hypothetical protein